MEVHCKTQGELRSAINKKAEIIIIEGDLAKKIKDSKQFQTATAFPAPCVGIIDPGTVTLILGLSIIAVLGILSTIALFKNYDLEAEYEKNGKLRFRAKK